jgi:hypothetical protein
MTADLEDAVRCGRVGPMFHHVACDVLRSLGGGDVDAALAAGWDIVPLGCGLFTVEKVR